jgi:hypothetical protein
VPDFLAAISRPAGNPERPSFDPELRSRQMFTVKAHAGQFAGHPPPQNDELEIFAIIAPQSLRVLVPWWLTSSRPFLACKQTPNTVNSLPM